MARRVLVLGSGGREHALAWALSRAPSVSEVLVAPGNPGCEGERVTRVAGASLEPDAVVRLARERAVDLVVVGPEAPLCAGVVDALDAAGIRAFGPTRAAARLEGSKAFLKDFAHRWHIPTARYTIARSYEQAERAIRAFERPLVVKADGLAAGKGAVVTSTADEALDAARAMLVEDSLGEAGRTVVIEERLAGVEMSVHAVTDGERLLVLPVARDHKRVRDGDRGPNTGGMGAFAPVALAPALRERIEREVLRPTLDGMRAEGAPYRGVLYAGLMVGEDGTPQLLEHNVRFGDPETQVLMALLDGDVAELFDSAARGALAPDAVTVRAAHAVVVVLAAHGYPATPQKGDVISGLGDAAATGATVFHAGTERRGEAIVTAGGRVLGVLGTGEGLAAARALAYRGVERIRFEGMCFRRDIAASALEEAQRT